MQPKTEFLATSIASMLLTRFTRTHERRGISVFAGHPGIGKTSAIARFKAVQGSTVAVIDLGEGPKDGHSSTAALRFAVEAIEAAADVRHYAKTAKDYMGLRARLHSGASYWANLRACADNTLADIPRLTLVFDEAQHLARGGIEALRSINDASLGGWSPFPIGLIFVGNQEFALRSQGGRPSVLTAAVQDRLLYSETLDYIDVTDDDLQLFLESHAHFESGAMALALKYFNSRTVNRSFRSAARLLERARAEVGNDPITTATLRHVLGL